MVSHREVGAVLNKAHTIIAELLTFSEDEYTPEACVLRDILITIIDYVRDSLAALLGDEAALERRSTSLNVQALGGILQALFPMLRYLKASASLTTPPALQVLVSSTVEKYFRSEGGTRLTIVRPQWHYNCKFVALSRELGSLLVGNRSSLATTNGFLRNTSTLVPHHDDIEDPPKTFATLVAAMSAGSTAPRFPDHQPPSQIAILSMAGLDKHDVLLYPMMAHEIGHFLTFEPPTPVHAEITESIKYDAASIRAIAKNENRSVDEVQISRVLTLTTDKIEVCVRELLADLIAIRTFGLGYFFTLAEYLSALYQWDDPHISPKNSYPSMRLRLTVAFRELAEQSAIKRIMSTARPRRFDREIKERLKFWQVRVEQPLIPTVIRTATAQPVDDSFVQGLAERAVINNQALIVKNARLLVPEAHSAIDAKTATRVDHLINELPPLLGGDDTSSIPGIFSAAWLYAFTHEILDYTAHERLGNLVTKAIELTQSSARENTIERSGKQGSPRGHSVLTGATLARRLSLAVENKLRLSIIPYKADNAGAGSLDVRLGHWFKVPRRTRLGSVDLRRAKMHLKRGSLHEEQYVRSGHAFTLHPGDFALGVTLEFIGMPADVMAFVEGKSTLGRTGLIVATATAVAPGFHGSVVLELVNAGTVPLQLYPEMEIAQLVFIHTSEIVANAAQYSGTSTCQVKP
jgi:dCTP deaminase